MTYKDLLLLLQSMLEANHTSMNDEIVFNDGIDKYYLDLVESLTTGEVYFIYGDGPKEEEP